MTRKSAGTRRRFVSAGLAAVLFAGVAIGIAVRGAPQADSHGTMTLAAARSALATATTFFLKVPNIPGEATDRKHRNEIVVQSFDWGLVSPAPQPSSSTHSLFDDFKITKSIDASSPALFAAAAQGTVFDTVALTGAKSTTASSSITYVTLTLSNARLTSFKQGGNADTGVSESFSFSYDQIRLTYVQSAPDGSHQHTFTGCWALFNNSPCDS